MYSQTSQPMSQTLLKKRQPPYLLAKQAYSSGISEAQEFPIPQSQARKRVKLTQEGQLQDGEPMTQPSEPCLENQTVKGRKQSDAYSVVSDNGAGFERPSEFAFTDPSTCPDKNYEVTDSDFLSKYSKEDRDCSFFTEEYAEPEPFLDEPQWEYRSQPGGVPPSSQVAPHYSEKIMRSVDQEENLNSLNIFNSNTPSTESEDFLPCTPDQPLYSSSDSSEGHNEREDEEEDRLSAERREEEKSKQLIQEAENLLSEGQAQLLSSKITSYDLPLSCKCSFHHSWSASLSELRQGKWCPQCTDLLSEARRLAQPQLGQILDKVFKHELTIQCPNGHQFALRPRELKQSMCGKCFQQNKKQMKQWIHEEQERKEQEDLLKQQQIYEQAKLQAQREYLQQQQQQQQSRIPSPGSQPESSSSSSQSQPSSQQQQQQQQYKLMQQRVIQGAQMVEAQIDTLAHKQAYEFMSKVTFDGKQTYEQIKEVYKMLIYPEQVLQMYLQVLSNEDLKTFYRNSARAIHPDKNSHPKAKDAFRKLHSFYEIACRGRI